MFNRSRMLLAAASLLGVAAAAPVLVNLIAPVRSFGDVGSPGRAPSRGKHKPRRHGQKLKSCRIKIGRRVRRKHRKAR